jgi:hypothetical protein
MPSSLDRDIKVTYPALGFAEVVFMVRLQLVEAQPRGKALPRLGEFAAPLITNLITFRSTATHPCRDGKWRVLDCRSPVHSARMIGN